VGVYETYGGKVVGSIDARGRGCDEHRLHQIMSVHSPAAAAADGASGREVAAIGRS
jgi:hypothetical protein